MADEAKRLSEDQLSALEASYRKIGVVEFSGHQLVFRKPSRIDCHEYRRQRESDAEKHLAMESLSQKMIAAFDGETDVNAARTLYTGTFLEDFPLFVNSPKAMNVISALSGIAEEEDTLDLGKGASVRSARLRTMREALQSGSDTAPLTKN